MAESESVRILLEKQNAIRAMGGQQALAELKRQGKKNARQRIDDFLDRNSFVELGAFVTSRNTNFIAGNEKHYADAIITGYGTVNNRLTYVYSLDSTILGGSIGEMGGKKIVTLYRHALQVGAPVVAFIDSSGLRLEEEIDGLNALGEIYRVQTEAKSKIIQICAIVGSCCGGLAVISGLSDFSFMLEQDSALFINSPSTFDDLNNEVAGYGNGNYCLRYGLVNKLAANEDTVIKDIAKLLSFLPDSSRGRAEEYITTDDLNRLVPEFEQVEAGVSGADLIAALADDRDWFELNKEYGSKCNTGIGRMNGRVVGFISSNTIKEQARLGVNEIKKITEFVAFLNDYHLPLVTLVDIEGFESSNNSEKTRLSKNIAYMIRVFAAATIPKVSLILNRAYGSAYVAFNSKHIGADIVFALPNSKISMLDSKSEVEIIYSSEIESSDNGKQKVEHLINHYSQNKTSCYIAAGRGYVDDIIIPSAARKRIIAGLEMLYHKKVSGGYDG